MMNNLLKNTFTNHHNLTPCNINIEQIVTHSYFEIDDINKKLIVHSNQQNGMAKYENPHEKEISIIDYDGFLTSLPQSFQQGKKRCDVIVHTTKDTSYFLLNELKEKNNKNYEQNNIEDAKIQLIETLNTLYTVPSIENKISSYQNKICCYCNSFPKVPISLQNTKKAFNRLSTITPNGIKMSDPRIEEFGFTYMEFKGNQTIKLI